MLDREATSVRFTLTSGEVRLEGELEDVKGEIAVASKSPLVLDAAAKADLRSIHATSDQPFLAVAATSVLQSLGNPIYSMEGRIEKALRTGDMNFRGKIRQGKKVRDVAFPLKLESATNERIVFSGRTSAPLSEIVDDLPFTLPDMPGSSWNRGTAKAEGRFSFIRKRSGK